MRAPSVSRTPKSREGRKPASKRRGSVITLIAVFSVALLGMVAFAIDLGYVATVDTELQRATDAGALAGAGMLVNGTQEAEAVVRDYVKQNLVGATTVTDNDIVVEFGQWDDTAKTFTLGGTLPSAVRVTVNRPDQPLFFARIFGYDQFSLSTSAIATYQPRDIMIVLDYSASMNDDSELRHIYSIGQAAVEANLLEIWNELGSPTFGNMQWQPVYISSDNTSTIKSLLGLDNVAYPYPSGSWSDYINYVKSDYYNYYAGYYKKYGLLNWVNYLLQRKPKANQTPDLWMTSEQPITAVKDAVSVFLAYLQEAETDDRVGLSVYTHTSGGGYLESGLTSDMQLIETISRQRQAGHYDYYTNIGGGMQVAREELEQNARPGAFKLMVLMTDGIANRPSNTSTAQQFALDEADLAADAGIPIVTISLGASADTALMQEIADRTGGVHFNIPGGQSVAEYEEDLKDVFRQVADDRPLKLVQ